jgi:membrane protein
MKKSFLKIFDFFNDDILYYSASLSFFTIFSLLPILALFIVVVSYLPIFNNYLALFTTYILDLVNPTHSKTIELTMQGFLSNTNELGFIGLFYLLFVFTLFFNNYEDIVNKIFNTTKRPIYKMFFLYISFLILIPILFMVFVLASSIFSGELWIQIITFIFMWALFCIIFKVSVSAKVTLKSAFFGSFVTLLTLSLTKKMFVFYVIYNTTYATIYGSFSVLLFFFLWIYISWTIYLYGIKLTALMNKNTTK